MATVGSFERPSGSRPNRAGTSGARCSERSRGRSLREHGHLATSDGGEKDVVKYGEDVRSEELATARL
jgi:hypothetical protein